MSKIRRIMAACAFLVVQCTWAYEVETHARLSQKAATCSILAQPAFMENLGLDGLEAEDPIWLKPVDVYDPEWIGEWIAEYVPKNVPAADKKYKPTIKTLIGWGAKFEDEEFLARPLNHFFDPLNGQPFHPCPFFGLDCNTSPDWALEDGEPRPDLDNQAQSFFDANDRFRYALGLASKGAREAAWAGFFQSLGMVIHHIQDMSQPQHVRNDAHCVSVLCKVTGDYNPSHYEDYTNDHRAAILNRFGCGAYPRLDLTRFNTARDFWNTADGTGIGMAEFTNRNFVSAGTNFRWGREADRIVVSPDGNYPQPDPQNGGTGLMRQVEDIRVLLNNPAFPLGGEMWFLGTQVTDNLLGGGSVTNPRSSSYSLWNDKLERYNQVGRVRTIRRTFNLNRFNFEAAYDFLMPRAIAYSAGLIDYFFRGRMAVSDVTYIGGDKVTLSVTNTTAEENPGNAPFAFRGLTTNQPGRFYLYQDEADGTRWEIPPVNIQDAELTYLEVLNAGDSMVLEFSLSAVPGAPSFALDKPLTLVYDGLVGEERGIAVANFSLSRLLAFDISRTAAGAPVPNIVDVYQSQDSGASWHPVAGIEIALSDTIPDIGDRLAVQAAT